MNRPDGKEAKVVMEQTANDVNHLKRSSSPDSSETDYRISYRCASLQKTNCETMFTSGCLRRIHQRTIT